jgi:hypothetical protein
VLEKLTELPALVVAGAIAIAVIYYLIQRKNDPVNKIPHEYFQRLWIWPPGSHTRWEAEVDVTIPGADKKVGFHSETLHDQVNAEGPTEAEVAFCKHQMSNLNELFELTKPAVLEAWKDWGKGEFPKDWTTVLRLDGLSVPKDGNIKEPWGLAWFCDPAGHYFMIEMRDGKASLASVDG